jgi:hypothetical protein
MFQGYVSIVENFGNSKRRGEKTATTAGHGNLRSEIVEKNWITTTDPSSQESEESKREIGSESEPENQARHDDMPVKEDNLPGFDRIVYTAYTRAMSPHEGTRPKFNITWWENESGKTTGGGLQTQDRILLAEIYSKAESVFEYGIGESTYMADYLEVPRYAGTDSDPKWISMARQHVSKRFRFYLGDIGQTEAWGYPQVDLAKNVLNYQLAPLIVEPLPFDVYMIDGRWRLASALASFLHASARGASPTETTVLIHDCNPGVMLGTRKSYYFASHLLNLTQHSGDRLCVYKRLPETTDEQLMQLWHEHMNVVHRR